MFLDKEDLTSGLSISSLNSFNSAYLSEAFHTTASLQRRIDAYLYASGKDWVMVRYCV